MNALRDKPLPEAPPGALYADRVRVYAKSVRGKVRRIKWAILAVCLAIYYLLPWLRWNRGPGLPDQAILLDISGERFYFFNIELWPQDIYLLTGALVAGAVALFLVTSLFGRLWCGYTCPQTVWTDLFMAVERWIEGDRAQRMRADRGPMTLPLAMRKAAKHIVWLGIAFWTGGAWIMYYVDAPTAVRTFWTGTASPEVYVFTALFTATTYLLAGWAREQVCTYMCPWPRFQSAMLDEQSVIVTYQAWRGEKRGHARPELRESLGLGDCLDCSACVQVCPTGIDIRDGVQLSCISCGLCVDACNNIMKASGGAPQLITWDTLERQAARARGEDAGRLHPHLLRPRTLVYAGLLGAIVIALAVGVATRSVATVSLIHDRAPLVVRLRDGSLRNGYTMKLADKRASMTWHLSVQGLDGATVSLPETNPTPAAVARFTTGADAVATMRVLIQAPAPADHAERLPITVTLTADDGTALSAHELFITNPGH